MTDFFQFNDPITIQLRAGTDDDPFISKSDSIKIINSIVVLDEVPDKASHVFIDDYVEIPSDKGLSPTSSQFMVNYQNGVVTFNSSKEGETVTITYMGRGFILYPASRIYAVNPNTDVIYNLQTMIDSGIDAIEAIDDVQDVIDDANEAIDSINDIESSIVAAESARVAAESSRVTAESSRSGAETSRASAETSRASAESSRASAETSRASNETSRGSAETSRASAESSRASAESSRVSVESARVTAESGRASAESTRVSAESSRASAETSRASAESTRGAAEIARASAETTRGTAEAGRVSAESARVTAESSRASAESSRVTVESARVTAESSRASAETTRGTNETSRLSAESTRVSNETSRGTAETTRGTNETNRASAETARASAETSRASAESSRVTAENTRISNESDREDAESDRATAEDDRVTAESLRVSEEINRGTAEDDRASAESSRESAESTRASNETDRIGRDTAFQLLEAYNAGHSYVPLNKVTYNGSSYQCKLNSTGNVPTNTTYWIQLAAKGIDGTGSGTVLSVTSANSDIAITNTTDNPELTLNSGTSGADKILKLDGSGLLSADLITDGTTNKAYTATEKTKLANAAELDSPVFTTQITIETSEWSQLIFNATNSGLSDGATVGSISFRKSDTEVANIMATGSGKIWFFTDGSQDYHSLYLDSDHSAHSRYNTLDDGTGNMTLLGSLTGVSATFNANDANLILDTPSTGQTASLYFKSGGTNKFLLEKNSSDDFVITDLTNTLFKITRSSGALTTKNNTLDNGSGSVGIGITTPTYTLDVQAPTAQLQLLSTTGTNASLIRINNTGGNLFFGRESSSGGAILGGSAAYSTVISSQGVYPLVLAVHSAAAMTIVDGGATTFATSITSPIISEGGYRSRKIVGTFSTTNTVANQKVDLYLPSTNLKGYIDVTVVGNWNNGNATGIVRKRYSINMDAGGTINSQNTRYEEAFGPITSHIAISNITWDSSNSRWKIQIVQISTSGNTFVVGIEVMANSTADVALVMNAALSSVYTTDTTVFSAPTVNFAGSVTAPNFISTISTGTSPFTVASTTLVTNLNADLLDGANSDPSATASTIVKRDGNAAINASVYISNIATGTAPFTVSSTTKVNNLNASFVNGKTTNQDLQTTDSPTFVRATFSQTTGTAPFTISSTTMVTNLNANYVKGYTIDQDLQTTNSPTFVRATFSQTTGTAPFTITSSTKVTNLNADSVDGWHQDQDTRTTGTPTFAGLTSSGTLTITDGSQDYSIFSSSSVLFIHDVNNNVDILTYSSVAEKFIISPDFQINGQLSLTKSSGAVMTVGNSTNITNLNADMVDGFHGTDLAIRRSNVKEQLLTGTSATNTATYTPSASGNFLIGISFRIVTAATNVTINVTYNDVTGAQTNAIVPITSYATGTYSLPNFMINAVSGTMIKVTVTSGTANHVYVSASILEV